MARFMGTVKGTRGMASRLGSPASGIETEARGWSAGVRVSGSVEDGRDTFRIVATGGSNDTSTRELVAIVSLAEDGSVRVDRPDALEREEERERMERTSERVAGLLHDKLRERFRFHLEHGGYCTPPGRAACALDAARAEERAEELGIEFVWQAEEHADTSWLEQDEFTRELARWNRGEMSCEWARAMLGDETLASLGGIFDADTSYKRVINAELASEAIATLTSEED